ncbi:MAG: TolB family protein [Oceanidesulfovibrio sp.]
MVFTRMTGAGHRIFLYDMKTGREQQLTFGPGSDEQPAFAPDNYFVAFASSRSGSRQVYLTTRHGTEPIQVPTGGPAGFPAWGLTDAP